SGELAPARLRGGLQLAQALQERCAIGGVEEGRHRIQSVGLAMVLDRGRIKLDDDARRWTPRGPSRLQGARSMTITSLAWVWRASGALLLCGSAFAQSLVNGGVVSGTISAPGERDSLTFRLFLLESFQIRVVDVNASAFSPQIEVYNP